MMRQRQSLQDLGNQNPWKWSLNSRLSDGNEYQEQDGCENIDCRSKQQTNHIEPYGSW